jgi:leucyl-tRNA synthetase
MSKSKGNVITPDAVAERYGADSLRIYELFIAPFEQAVAWSDRGVQGCYRFLNRYYTLALEIAGLGRATEEGAASASSAAPASSAASDGASPNVPAAADGTSDRTRDLLRTVHKTIRKVGSDMECFRFNTAVAALMEAQNEIGQAWHEDRDVLSSGQWRELLRTFTLLLAPMAPHVAEEVWQLVGDGESVLAAPWPAWDEALAADQVVTVVVQVNGKLRDRLEVPADAARDDVLASARAVKNTQRFLEGKQVVKEIYVPGKLVNFVVR